MDLITLILLDVLFFFGSHLVTLVFYGIGMISEKPKSVMRWYIAGTILDVFAALGLLSLIHRSQNGIPTKENLLSLTGSVVICTAFYFIMRRKAKRLRNTTIAIPASRYQTQESEMGKFVVDSETGEVTREEPIKPKQSNTISVGEHVGGTGSVRLAEPPVVQSVSAQEPDTPKNRVYKTAVISLSAVCAVLAIFVFLLGYSANSTRAEHQQLMDSVEALTAENAALQETISELKSQNDEAKNKVSDLTKERDYISRELDNLSNGIGFIVNGSEYYHTSDCSVYKHARTYQAHNIEYCKSLGYSKCPECGENRHGRLVDLNTGDPIVLKNGYELDYNTGHADRQEETIEERLERAKEAAQNNDKMNVDAGFKLGY